MALDLHELDSNLYYAHFIDYFTRLSGAAIIRSKDPGIILNTFLQHWVSLYGSPRRVLSDNENLIMNTSGIWQKALTSE